MAWSQVYRRGSDEFAVVVRGLSPEQVGTTAPACPAWTVHDLLAHLAGSATDLVGGNVEGVTTAPWNAQQVEDRRRRTTVELLAEWRSNVDASPPGATAPPARTRRGTSRSTSPTCGRPSDSHPGPSTTVGAGSSSRPSACSPTRPTVSIAQCEPDPEDTTWHVATAYGLWRALFSRLDRAALEREVLRGDAAGFARAACGDRPVENPPGNTWDNTALT